MLSRIKTYSTAALLAIFATAPFAHAPAYGQTDPTLAASLSPNTPPAQTIPAGTQKVELTQFNLTAGASGDVTVKKIILTRIGLSSDGDLTQLTLVDKATSANIASIGNPPFISGKAEFTLTNPYIISKLQTKIIGVEANFSSTAQNGNQIGVAINAASDITATSGAENAFITGSFPVKGNVMTIVGATTNPLPDLKPITLEVKNTTRDYNQAWQYGDLIDIKYSIQNAGTVSSNRFYYTIEWGDPNGRIRSEILSLAPNESSTSTQKIMWSNAVKGNVAFTLTADSEKQIQETDEGNNVLVQTVNTSGSNQPPVITGVSGPTALKVNETGTWSVTASDSDGTYLSYTVNWGDNLPQDKLAQTPTEGQKATFTHSYAQSGTYTITFTVTDDKGASAKATITVAVGEASLPVPPVITDITGPTSLIVNQTGTWTIKVYDPDNTALDYLVVWGDGAPDTDDPYFIKTGKEQVSTVSHMYTKTGIYTIQFQVFDPFTMTNVREEREVKVIEKPTDDQPSITRISPASGPVGTVLTIYGKNLQNDCKGRDAGVCQLTVSIGGYEIKRDRFVELKVTWLQDRVSLIVPKGAQTGPVRIVRVDSENPEKSYDITGPVFSPVFTTEPSSGGGGGAGSGTTVTPQTRVAENESIRKKAIVLSNNDIDALLAEIRTLRSQVKEQEARIKYLEKLTKGTEELSVETEEKLNTFITYGVDENTKKLGEGERAAVLHSYKSAYDKLPETDAELEDAIRIANGRWPNERNVEAEAQAKISFKKIYLREPDTNNPNDSAAIMIMTYGLKQQAKNRNLTSEGRAIGTFRSIYKRTPSSTEDWNIMQATAYSGAKRK